MILVIAEKPSVAQSIAKVLGATSRKDGYLEGNNYIVSWCVGHLVGLADASSYDERYAKWRYDDLPIVPEIILGDSRDLIIYEVSIAAFSNKEFAFLIGNLFFH